MTDPTQEHGVEARAADPTAAVQNPNHPEPVDEGSEEKDEIEVTAHGSRSVSSLNEKRLDIDRTLSYATNASVPESHTQEIPKKKAWYKHINPLRWGGIPPVPEKRTVSREYTAPFLSLVYFQWIAPLMQVCEYPKHLR